MRYDEAVVPVCVCVLVGSVDWIKLDRQIYCTFHSVLHTKVREEDAHHAAEVCGHNKLRSYFQQNILL